MPLDRYRRANGCKCVSLRSKLPPASCRLSTWKALRAARRDCVRPCVARSLLHLPLFRTPLRRLLQLRVCTNVHVLSQLALRTPTNVAASSFGTSPSCDRRSFLRSEGGEATERPCTNSNSSAPLNLVLEYKQRLVCLSFEIPPSTFPRGPPPRLPSWRDLWRMSTAPYA
jgi:hypothetical protein